MPTAVQTVRTFATISPAGSVMTEDSLAHPESHHEPVLLEETIRALQPKPGGTYLDGTFGGGGHSRALLHGSAPDGIVLAIDRDPEAIARGQRMIEAEQVGQRLRLIQGSFADMASLASAEGIDAFDGILLDLGLSSFQLDTPERGFSFRRPGPLDMRFDPSQALDARALVHDSDERELAEIIWRYGEDPRSRRIAREIVRARQASPISDTAQLAAIVERAVGGRRGAATHPATRTFQALRIATNDELQALEQALAQAVELLKPDGRLAVISFHSLEDRLVKQFFARESATCVCPPEQPVCTCQQTPRLRPIGRKIRPSDLEIARNPRSRSAVLRVAERLAVEA